MLDERMMRCPYCDRIFWITEDEQNNNETFECSHCGKSNAGCSEVDGYGILIGVSMLNFELQEFLRSI